MLERFSFFWVKDVDNGDNSSFDKDAVVLRDEPVNVDDVDEEGGEVILLLTEVVDVLTHLQFKQTILSESFE